MKRSSHPIPVRATVVRQSRPPACVLFLLASVLALAACGPGDGSDQASDSALEPASGSTHVVEVTALDYAFAPG